ncbi:hypothetical protein NDU88_002696 [Pleurodeles waltl]|uniref:Uncharacterized protein n=1 Tax=Pleurodeles waltl TaxID=8319 RepID=A0AAV7MTI7_PLEWA|nr:hypothetical protein NDU88_002696 [Pleurodeles waltl]
MDTAILEARVLMEKTTDHHNQLLLRQQHLRIIAEIAENRAHSHALALQHQLYDIGDKARKPMAWLEKRDKGHSWVPVTLDKTNALQMMGTAMVNTFAAYYEDLYKSATDMTETDCADLLKDVTLQILTGEERELLEPDLTEA